MQSGLSALMDQIDKLSDDIDHISHEGMCCICMHAPHDAQLLPCMHNKFCKACLERHLQNNKHCPVCCTAVRGMLTTFG